MPDDPLTVPPLSGLRVVEFGSLIAGPFCTRLLADFGADVVKIEPPGGGDPLREWGLVTEHGSLWSMVQSRNKLSVTLDLRQEEGRQIARRLIDQADVVVENFRPGTFERWGLSYADLSRDHPELIMVRISGYGQTGPYSQQPGFGNVAEAMGGIRYITGWQDRPPLRVGLSLGDTIAALHAAVGALVALQGRRATGRGQVVDVALSESVLNTLESIIPEYGFDGRVRERTGNMLSGAAPSNTYQTADGNWLAVGANSDPLFNRLCGAMGQPELASDPRFVSNQTRRTHVEELDGLIGAWIGGLSKAEAMDVLVSSGIPAGPVYSVKDIAEDPQYQARQMLLDVPDDRVGHVLMPGIIPVLSETPGSVRWPGADLGAHTQQVLTERLGLSAEDVARLRERGIV